MFSSKLRALATALVIGTAAVSTIVVLTTTTAEAAVRKAIGTALQEALAAAGAGNYSAANAKIREAEAVSGKSAEEDQKIQQMKAYVASKSGDFSALGGKAGAQAKFSAAYNARRYQDVINMEDELRKNNALDGQSQQVIAQSYYNLRNYAGCTRYLRQSFPGGGGETVLGLQRSCAHESGDVKTEQDILERLVGATGAAKYWSPLLQSALRTRGLRDPQTLDIFRLKYLTGAIATELDYTTLAQLAIALGMPKEGKDVVQKGIDNKILTGERINRLVKFASDRATQADAQAAQTLAAANASPNGDALVKFGEYQNSVGKSADAVKNIQAGIAKGVTDKNFAQVRLGLAYIGNKQKDQALKAFAAVKGDPAWEMDARLWSLYARR